MAPNHSPFEGFSATITGISLFDYMQLIMMTHKNKIIEIRSGKHLGVIQIQNGKVVFAKSSDGKTGKDSFFEMMSWENGTFKEIHFEKNLNKNVIDLGNLLLEAAEYIDNKKLNQEKEFIKESIEDAFETPKEFGESLDFDLIKPDATSLDGLDDNEN
ncbi:DUF4388 domain-containing protein [bacterium]|nr:DUF4388 domain-containing protein [bacterium]